jgi:hypothetical protein
MGFLLRPVRALLTLGLVALVVVEIVAAQQFSYPFDKPVVTGALPSRDIHRQSLGTDGKAGSTLLNWTGSFTYNNTTYPYTMLGTDPSLGSHTTVIQAILIPIKFAFANGTVLDASAPVYGQNQSAVQLTQESPLFKPVPFKPGGTNVGTTQYIDAFQRANFWNLVSTTAPDYHVKFKLTTAPLQTLKVPTYFGYTRPGPGNPIGFVDNGWYDGQLGVILFRLKIKTNTLPMFLIYNTIGITPTFYYAGYHTAYGNPAQVYLSAGFFDQGIYSYGGDVIFLSHEMGEATDDPFITNLVPQWKNPETGTCSNLLEIGDPVPDVGIPPIVRRGYTYHPQDLTFLPWFAQLVPSTSVNGWYTFGDALRGPPPICK